MDYGVFRTKCCIIVPKNIVESERSTMTSLLWSPQGYVIPSKIGQNHLSTQSQEAVRFREPFH